MFPAPISAETRTTLEENLENAEIVYGRNPDNADATIWIGRRVAYLGRYPQQWPAFGYIAAEADLVRATK